MDRLTSPAPEIYGSQKLTYPQLAQTIFEPIAVDPNKGKVQRLDKVQPVEATPKEEYRRGFTVFKEILIHNYNQLHPEAPIQDMPPLQVLGHLNNPLGFDFLKSEQTLLNAAHDYIYHSISINAPQLTPQQFAREEESRRQEYWRSCQEVYRLIRPGRQENIIRNCFNSSPDLEKNPPDPSQYHIEEFRMNHGDVLQVITANGIDATQDERMVAVLHSIEYTWRQLKLTETPLTQTVYLHSANDPNRLRAYAYLNGAIIDMGHPDLTNTASHETIHEVFFAEGALGTDDFAEGMATAISLKLYPNSSFGDPVNYIGADLLRYISTRDSVLSHTQALGVVPSEKITENDREYSYIFGFCLAKAIMDSPAYQASVESARRAGNNPYRLLFDIGRSLSHPDKTLQTAGLPPDTVLRRRDLVKLALTQNGINPNEINRGIVSNIQQINQRYQLQYPNNF